MANMTDNEINKPENSFSSAITEAEKKFIRERAERFKINAKERIQWIDDAWEMIQHARKTLK